MAISVERVCDKHRDRAVAAPTELRVSNTIWTTDACEECTHGLMHSFMQLGFRPAKSHIGNHAPYVTATGKLFGTKEARTWLAQQGYQVSTAGRLPNELLRLYADAH